MNLCEIRRQLSVDQELLIGIADGFRITAEIDLLSVIQPQDFIAHLPHLSH